MEEKESEVTKAVREAVVKAVEKGEDIKEKVVEIARDAVKKLSLIHISEPTRPY